MRTPTCESPLYHCATDVDTSFEVYLEENLVCLSIRGCPYPHTGPWAKPFVCHLHASLQSKPASITVPRFSWAFRVIVKVTMKIVYAQLHIEQIDHYKEIGPIVSEKCKSNPNRWTDKMISMHSPTKL